MTAVSALLWKLRIDDPVGAVPVHMSVGIWGVLAVGIFSPTGDFGTQLLGIAAIVGWTAVTSSVLFFILKLTMGLRVSGVIEDEGLDVHEHGAVAYS